MNNKDHKDYPGLVVCRNRVSGSITAGASRLPLWGMTAYLFESWKAGVLSNCDDTHGWTEDQFKSFVHHILDHRGEFGRLICILADVERRETERNETRNGLAWWERPSDVKRVSGALRRCLEALENGAGPWGSSKESR